MWLVSTNMGILAYTTQASYIRHKDFRPSSITLRLPPPWILKRDGLESYGQRLISSIGKKNKRIEKKWKSGFLKLFQIFRLFNFFQKKLDLFGFFYDILLIIFVILFFFYFDFLKICFGSLEIFRLFRFFEFFCIFFIFLKIIKITNKRYGGYNWQNGVKYAQRVWTVLICLKGKTSLGQSPPQVLEVSPRSRLYLLVVVQIEKNHTYILTLNLVYEQEFVWL